MWTQKAKVAAGLVWDLVPGCNPQGGGCQWDVTQGLTFPSVVGFFFPFNRVLTGTHYVDHEYTTQMFNRYNLLQSLSFMHYSPLPLPREDESFLQGRLVSTWITHSLSKWVIAFPVCADQTLEIFVNGYDHIFLFKSKTSQPKTPVPFFRLNFILLFSFH